MLFSQEKALWQFLCAALGCSPYHVDIVWAESVSPVLNGAAAWPTERFDVLSSGITITADRAAYVTFSEPYMT